MAITQEALTNLALRLGANRAAVPTISRRSGKAHQIIADLHGDGFVIVKKDEWDTARLLVEAVRRATSPEE
jgi:hypothetical protein